MLQPDTNQFQFYMGYIEAMFWTEEHELGDAEMSDETLKSVRKDCDDFLEKFGHLLPQDRDMDQHGHDYWLTRNGHGAGFWDRGYGPVGDTLSKHAQERGEVHVYVGDDGDVYYD